ncbi:hypothetical protein SAMN05660909_03540 [Chitinophaga terrae (ex Kim and Jung 2007)]|uniref:Uncharacterized protein n=1 Tax=Chitinophaga terrae (ex Kim and Jung 2007) TaxID=408074 RepID=A0A1H4E617_9BACT|nr:hypothetical protein [Chitinophaga terrae (ex Kim and Jung 2007)]GEP91366.1 hypothetical protein CTE07_30110 [Chitinophaga terrae (ex Kim and Jung 2007)]SEA80495.1 hypothetical protein SAMN05660909_03540 [Chitinophaga terrae (ex Kim and Jung 2007)]
MKTILIACSMLLAATLLSVTPATAKTTSVANAWKPMVMKSASIVTKTYNFNLNYPPSNPPLKIILTFDDSDFHLVNGDIQGANGTMVTYHAQSILTPNAPTNVQYVNFKFTGQLIYFSVGTT